MNTYNDNLRNNIVSSLDTIEKDVGKTNAIMNGSTFSLYYAQGTKISAQEKYESAMNNWSELNALNAESIKNKNLGATLLTTAAQEKDFVAKSTTNTALAAQSIQVAANTILKLASDVGSVLSIVSAADYGTEIFKQANYAHNVMEDTAYNAEKASQLSMEASALIASVSAVTVDEKATITNTSITDLSAVLDANVKAAHEALEVSATSLDKAIEVEKNLEGKLEDVIAEYKSTEEAYKYNQKELNLDLKVEVNESFLSDDAAAESITDDKFKVSFLPFRSPFEMPPNGQSGESGSTDGMGDSDTESAESFYQPVTKYCVYIVEDSRKSSFTLSSAEANADDKSRCQEIAPNKDGKSVISHVFDLTNKNMINDSSGNPIVKGKSYVVFVMAELTTAYKKTLNNFEDYLSAPSSSFKLTNKLAPADYKSFAMKDNVLSFEVNQASSGKEYRCMFLPASDGMSGKTLTTENLINIEKKLTKGNEIANKKRALKSKLGATTFNKLKSLYDDVKRLRGYNDDHRRIIELKEKLKKGARGEEKDRLKQEIDEQKSHIKNHESEIEKLLKKNKGLKEYIALMLEEEMSKDGGSSISFKFNKSIAEQVSSGNYIKSSGKGSNSPVSHTCKISNITTDNFGQRLVAGNSYIPVVLSYSTAGVTTIAQFENALSDFEKTAATVLIPAESK